MCIILSLTIYQFGIPPETLAVRGNKAEADFFFVNYDPTGPKLNLRVRRKYEPVPRERSAFPGQTDTALRDKSGIRDVALIEWSCKFPRARSRRCLSLFRARTLI